MKKLKRDSRKKKMKDNLTVENYCFGKLTGTGDGDLLRQTVSDESLEETISQSIHLQVHEHFSQNRRKC